MCIRERHQSDTGGGGRQVSYVPILCHVYHRERDQSETGGGGRQVSYVPILCHVYRRERSVRHWRIISISISDMMM